LLLLLLCDDIPSAFDVVHLLEDLLPNVTILDFSSPISEPDFVRLLRACPNLTKLTVGPRKETMRKTVVNTEIEAALTGLSRLAIFESSFEFSPSQLAQMINACMLTRMKFSYVIKPGILVAFESCFFVFRFHFQF
jgi:hypothetical protein